MAERLLCILSNMNAGGAETFLMKLYRTIDREKYQFDFCVNIKEKNFYEDEILRLGGNVYRIPSKSESLKEFKKQLTNVVKSHEYKYVLRITANAAGLLDLKIAKKAGAKICIARSSNSNAEGGIKSRMLHRIGQTLYLRYVDKKIAPSDLAAIYTFGNPSYSTGEVKIIHNALNVEEYKFSKEDRIHVREELNIPQGACLIGHIGRFMQQKNHDKLIRVFQEVCKKNENARLLLVGNGELENTIRKMVDEFGITNKVVFAGVRSDIPRLLSCMDLFVMPSLYEGMPNTVIEAQANGLYCVISDTITKEADITGNVCFISLEESEQKWASTICNHINDIRKDTKDQFIDRGYDITTVAREFERFVFGDE